VWQAHLNPRIPIIALAIHILLVFSSSDTN
jgi:malic enzyme